MNIIKQRIADSIETKQRILADDMLVRHIETAAMMVSDALKAVAKFCYAAMVVQLLMHCILPEK